MGFERCKPLHVQAVRASAAEQKLTSRGRASESGAADGGHVGQLLLHSVRLAQVLRENRIRGQRVGESKG